MESSSLRDQLIYSMSERSNFSEHTKKIMKCYDEEARNALVSLTDKVSEEYGLLILEVKVIEIGRSSYRITHPLFHNLSNVVIDEHLDMRVKGKYLLHLSFSNLFRLDPSVIVTFLVNGNKNHNIYLKPLFEDYPTYQQIGKI